MYEGSGSSRVPARETTTDQGTTTGDGRILSVRDIANSPDHPPKPSPRRKGSGITSVGAELAELTTCPTCGDGPLVPGEENVTVLNRTGQAGHIKCPDRMAVPA